MKETDVKSKPGRSPEEIRALRDRLSRDRPTMDQLVDAGEIGEPVPQGQFMALRVLMHALKAERQRQKLSLTDVAEESGLTRAAISRLENGHQSNPTLETLYRYSLALGQNISLTLEPTSKRAKTTHSV